MIKKSIYELIGLNYNECEANQKILLPNYRFLKSF